MSQPFVVSYKITGDGRSAVDATRAVREELEALSGRTEVAEAKTIALNAALGRRGEAQANQAGLAANQAAIRGEQELEAARLRAQISETGRAQSIERLARLGREAQAVTQALVASEREIAAAQQASAQAARSAAEANQQLETARTSVAMARQGAIDASFGIGAATGNRGADIAAYGRELDQLRAQFNPLFAAEQRHEASLVAIQRAHQLGAISTAEMSQAVTREGIAYAQAVAAIDGNTEAMQRNAAVRAGRSGGEGGLATANIAAQFQDIAVTSAMGMSPLQIALQQGTQISAAFGNMGAAGAVKALGEAFLSIISPVSLVTIGLVAGAAAAIQFFSGLREEEVSAAEALEAHKDKLDELLAGYEQARTAAYQVLDQGVTRPEASVVSDLGAFREDALERYSELLQAITVQQAQFQQDVDLSLQADGPDALVGMMQRVLDIVTEAGLGAETTAAEFDSLDTALTLIKNSGADDSIVYIAERMLELVQAARSGHDTVDSLTAALDAIPRDIQIRLSVGAEFGNSIDQIQDLYIDPRSRFDIARENLQNSYDQAAATAQSYGDIVGAGEEYTRVLASIDAAEDEVESKKAARSAAASARSAAEVSAFDRQIKSIQERAAAQQVETNVIGLGTFASERARIVLQLENAAREDAIGLSAGRAAQIQEEATAYAMVAAAQEKAVEQQRAATEQMDFYKGTATGFLTDLRRGLMDGTAGWDDFGNAAANALDRIADRAAEMAGNGLIDLLFNSVLSGIGGGLGSGLSGVSSIDPYGSTGTGFFPGFADGGWTGGGRGQVRGLVHGEEFVVQAGPASQHRRLLETINAGGSVGGGFTFAPTNIIQMPAGSGRAEFEAMLDERDSAMEEQFNAKVMAVMDNPRRAG